VTSRVQDGRAARRSSAAAMLFLGCALALSGCGYRLSGMNTFLPERIHVIMIAPFENRTQRPEIEQRVTEQVARELAKRGRYRVVSDRKGADALLEGAITEYRSTPVQLDAQGRATRLETVVTLQATLRDLQSEAVLWSQSGLVFREQYDVQAEVLEENLALDQIAEGAAEALVNSMFEGF
jgi:outer membrane lipopolysaccharide assembly protein LptE/RlpB